MAGNGNGVEHGKPSDAGIEHQSAFHRINHWGGRTRSGAVNQITDLDVIFVICSGREHVQHGAVETSS
jgi:hypothetical protein